MVGVVVGGVIIEYTRCPVNKEQSEIVRNLGIRNQQRKFLIRQAFN